MHPTLTRALESLENAAEGLPRDLAAATGAAWSPAQIVEHVALGWRLTGLGARAALSDGKPRARARRFKDRVAGLVVLGLGRFPGGRKSPPAAVPRGLSLGEALAAARDHLADMDAALAGAEERFGRVAVLDHPVLGPLTVPQWRRFHLVHARHHARQIRARRQNFGTEPVQTPTF